MARSPSYAGLWALLGAALRRKAKGYRLHYLSLRKINMPIQLEGVSWTLSRMIYVSEIQSRWVIHAWLDPHRRIAGARRRRDLEKRIDRHFHGLGYRPRTVYWRPFRYERAIDAKGETIKSWIRLLDSAEVDPGRKASRSLSAAFRSRLKEGWEITGFSMHGPTRRVRAGVPWIIVPYVFWAVGEGMSLIVDVSPAKRMSRSELQKNEAALRFLADVERHLKRWGLRNPLGTVSKRSMNRGPFHGMVFDRRRIIPARLGQTLDRLQDWSPMESARRPT